MARLMVFGSNFSGMAFFVVLPVGVLLVAKNRITSDDLTTDEPSFVPLDADGLPMSLDIVSQGDTTSESYGSCELSFCSV